MARHGWHTDTATEVRTHSRTHALAVALLLAHMLTTAFVRLCRPLLVLQLPSSSLPPSSCRHRAAAAVTARCALAYATTTTRPPGEDWTGVDATGGGATGGGVTGTRRRPSPPATAVIAAVCTRRHSSQPLSISPRRHVPWWRCRSCAPVRQCGCRGWCDRGGRSYRGGRGIWGSLDAQRCANGGLTGLSPLASRHARMSVT